jgi:thiamine-phosphate pyrophosphorylase
MEGLRVVEEIARMVLEKKTLFHEIKSLRHEIHNTILESPVTYDELIAARNSSTDVGRKKHKEETVLQTELKGVFDANVRRIQEALRVLEEFFKLVDIQTSLKFKEIRFRAYELQEKLLTHLKGRKDERKS